MAGPTGTTAEDDSRGSVKQRLFDNRGRESHEIAIRHHTTDTRKQFQCLGVVDPDASPPEDLERSQVDLLELRVGQQTKTRRIGIDLICSRHDFLLLLVGP